MVGHIIAALRRSPLVKDLEEVLTELAARMKSKGQLK